MELLSTSWNVLVTIFNSLAAALGILAAGGVVVVVVLLIGWLFMKMVLHYHIPVLGAVVILAIFFLVVAIAPGYGFRALNAGIINAKDGCLDRCAEAGTCGLCTGSATGSATSGSASAPVSGGGTTYVQPPAAAAQPTCELRADALSVLTSSWPLRPGTEAQATVNTMSVPSGVSIELTCTDCGPAVSGETWSLSLSDSNLNPPRVTVVVNGRFARNGFDAPTGGMQVVGTGGDWATVCPSCCNWIQPTLAPTTAAPPATSGGAAAMAYPFSFAAVTLTLPQGTKTVCGCQSADQYVECGGDNLPQWGNETNVPAAQQPCRAP